MARSMQEDEVDDDYDENEIIELDSQTDYMSKSVSFNSIINYSLNFNRTKIC